MENNREKTCQSQIAWAQDELQRVKTKEERLHLESFIQKSTTTTTRNSYLDC